MKTLKNIAFVFLLCLFSYDALAQTTYKVTAQRVNVRNKPSTKALVVGVLNQGDTISVSDISDGWASFSFKGKTRYIDTLHIEMVNENKSLEMDVESPVKNSVSTEPSENDIPETQHPISYPTKIGNNTTSTKRKDNIWHLHYYNSLKEGDKGAYGIGFDGVDYDGGFGGSFRMTTNAFLVDADYVQLITYLGPNYSIGLGNIGYMVFPVMVGIFGYSEVSFDDKGKKNKDTKVGCGLEVSPYLAIGKNGGIAIGPTWNISFVNGESSWGAHIALWF